MHVLCISQYKGNALMYGVCIMTHIGQFSAESCTWHFFESIMNQPFCAHLYFVMIILLYKKHYSVTTSESLFHKGVKYKMYEVIFSAHIYQH